MDAGKTYSNQAIPYNVLQFVFQYHLYGLYNKSCLHILKYKQKTNSILLFLNKNTIPRYARLRRALGTNGGWDRNKFAFACCSKSLFRKHVIHYFTYKFIPKIFFYFRILLRKIKEKPDCHLVSYIKNMRCKIRKIVLLNNAREAL